MGAVWKPKRGSKSKTKQRERRGVIVGGSRFGRPNGEIHFFLDLLDLDREGAGTARIPLHFLAHGFALHPTKRREAALFEKRGPGGAYVDLVERRVLRTIAPLPGHAFYGHGAFTRGGAAVLAVEMDLATRAGVISVRDAASFEPLDRFPTFGARPHDCVLVDGGKTLAVTNGGGDVGDAELACVAFIDVERRTLLERFDVDSPSINAGHLAVTNGRDFAVVSAPREGLPEQTSPGGVSLRVAGGPLRQLREPAAVLARAVGETLSVCIDAERGVVATTCPYGGLLAFWRLGDGALVRLVELPNVRGVTLTLDRRCYAVAYGPAASLALFDVTTLEPLATRDAGQKQFSGSHIYAWDNPG